MKARSRFSLTPTKHSNRGNSQKSVRWTRAAVVREFKALADPRVRAKMSCFGVYVPNAHRISAPVLHGLATRIGKNHRLAHRQLGSGHPSARLLAPLARGTA